MYVNTYIRWGFIYLCKNKSLIIVWKANEWMCSNKCFNTWKVICTSVLVLLVESLKVQQGEN